MLWTTLNNRFPRIATMLGTAVHNERAGHAYLFVGDSPDLLAECAKAWAQARSCQAPREDGTPCGECRNCLLIERDSCPELYVLKPRSKSRAIVVDRIREFEHQLGLTVEKGRIKVGLIQEAECMNPQAQNAFLKTLEEPPPRTVLLLTTTNPRRLLPTIRSRCQQLSLLQNQRDYALALEGELPAILSELRAESGAGVALRVATTLCGRFSSLRDRAVKEAEESADPRWEQAAEDDAQLRKQLETEQKARESARYLAMREQLVEAIQTWAQQESLRAAGVPFESLPHSEMLCPHSASAPPPAPAAEHADRYLEVADRFASVMRTNADESLAIHGFCLEIARKEPKPKGPAPTSPR